MRERWEAGARDDFCPYGRSTREVLATHGTDGSRVEGKKIVLADAGALREIAEA